MNPAEVAGLIAGASVLAIAGLALLGVLIPVVAYWKILSKTGHPGPLALLFLLPFVGIIMLYWLALADWPALRQAAPPAPAGGPPPRPPQAITPLDPAPAQAAGRFCAGCGSALEGAGRFCRHCGRPVGA